MPSLRPLGAPLRALGVCCTLALSFSCDGSSPHETKPLGSVTPSDGPVSPAVGPMGNGEGGSAATPSTTAPVDSPASGGAPGSPEAPMGDAGDGAGGASDTAAAGEGGSAGVTPTPAQGGSADGTGTGGAAGTSAAGTSAAGTSGSAGAAAEGGSGGGGQGGNPSEQPVAAEWPLINGVQWADVAGNPIQAHGGGVLKVADDYFWFGENRNPDGTFYAVSAYRSKDLKRWEHAHDVLTMNSDPGLAPANVERPKVVFNEATGRYVMWMHWENGRDYGEARAAVASSDTVDGDYTYHGSFRPMQDTGVMDHDKPGYMSRDCTLFVDDDGRGYFLSSSNENYDLHLYLLSEDYLSIENRAALLFEGGHREAPALFKRGSTYFLLTSGSTGWDPNQARYATSTSLTSGWSSLKDIADGTTFHSQSTFVLPIQGSEGTSYLYLGDRWAGAWEGRVNDSSYVWQPIAFQSDTSMSMTWSNNVEIDVAAGSVSGSVDAFTLTNENSGLVLAVEGPANENSADVIQDESATATSAVWRFEYDGAGHFVLTNESGKVLDVPDESTEPIDLHLWDGNGGAHQSWRLVDLGEGRYLIRNENSGLLLGVADASSEALASVQQQVESGGPEQVWSIRAE